MTQNRSRLPSAQPPVISGPDGPADQSVLIARRRKQLDPDRPQAVFEEFEPSPPSGGSNDSTQPERIGGVTVLLTASRCPLRCTMCDLWHNTLTHPTPPGAMVRQIEAALDQTQHRGWIKLYNAGNFFDTASVPREDYAAIARAVNDFDRVIVENHPRIGPRHINDFDALIDGQLEIAIGLETVHPRMLERWNKRFTRDQLESFLSSLHRRGIDSRVFLMVGGPGWSVDESIAWARCSVRYAAHRGCRHATLIPVRRDDGQSAGGWNGQGDRLPTLTTADLARLQTLALGDLQSRGSSMIVTIDLWNQDAADPIVPIIEQRNQTQTMVTST